MVISQALKEKDLNTLKLMLQAYEAEFSVITGKKPDDKGVFKLDVDLNKTDNYLLYEKEEAVGFCVKGFSNQRHDIYEFYIAPQKRGNKLGSKFAQAIFKKHPGPWQVRQIEGADKAREFWRKVIGEAVNGNFQESFVKDDYWGYVTKQTFFISA